MLVDAADLVFCDRGASVALSGETVIEMSDAPTGNSVTPTAASATLVALFDCDAVAIKCTRRVNWQLRRGLVSVISGVGY